MVYAQYLGRRLFEAVESVAAKSDLVHLRDELTLSRVMVGEFLELYNQVDKQIERRAFDGDPISDIEASKMRVMVAEQIIDKLRDVESIAKSATAIESQVMIDVPTLQTVLAQVIEMVEESFANHEGEDSESLQRLADTLGTRIKDEVRLPSGKGGLQTVELLPGQVVKECLAMDATVPPLPKDEL